MSPFLPTTPLHHAGPTMTRGAALHIPSRGFWRAYVVGHALRPALLTAATPTGGPSDPIFRAAPEITLRVTSPSALSG